MRTSEYEVGAGINLSSKLVKGGGHPIKLPFIDVSEIGAGGGSIVAVDELGTISVGPCSAGASPGPVCYDLGGIDPTLTDALLALGYLERDGSSAAARSPSTPPPSRDALDRVVATPLGRSVEEAAYGILQLAVATMTRAVKAVTTYRGRDPARLHALRLRRQRPAHRGRDRPRAAHPQGADPSGARGLQRARPALLRHRARGRAHPDAARDRGDRAPTLEDAFAELEEEATANVVASDARRRQRRRGSRTSATRARPTSCPFACLAGDVDVGPPRRGLRRRARPAPTGTAPPTTRSTSSRCVRSRASSGRPPGGTTRWPRSAPAPHSRARGRRTSARRSGRVETPVCNRAGLLAGERRGPAPRRRGRLHLRRPAGLRRAARRLRQHRGRDRWLSHRPARPSTRSRSRWSRTRSPRPPTRWRS